MLMLIQQTKHTLYNELHINLANYTYLLLVFTQKNHMKSFRDPKKLVQILIPAWKEMTGLQPSLLDGEIALQEEAKSADILMTVDSWNDKKDPQKCEQHLKALVQLKLDLAKSSMTPWTWPILYLSKPSVQNYLKWVVKVTKDKSVTVTEVGTQNTSEYIKPLMRQLVDPSDLSLVENFADKHHISKWLYQSDKMQDILPLECTDFLTFQHFIDQALENLYQAKAKSDVVSQQQAQIHATTCVAQVVNYLRNHLLKANQKYEDLFIVTLLYPFRYDIGEGMFLCLLSTDDLENLTKNFREQSTEYFSIKETSLLRKQAYLFYLAVSVFHSETSTDISEFHVKQHLQYMQKALQNELLPQVHEATTATCTGSETGYVWTAIQFDLSLLMSGIKMSQDNEGILEDILREAKDDISIAERTTTTCPLPKVTPQTGAQKRVSQVFRVLLEMIDVQRYYPQKLTPTDAVCLRKETLGSLQYTEQPELLPYFIMQKIMMHNYKSRTYILHDPRSIADICSDSDDEDEHSESKYQDVHPMDGLLALIHCADNFLRQDLMAKLSTCKLAIPFLLPDPKDQTLTFPLWAMRSIIMEWKSKGGDKSTSKDMEFRIVDCKTPIVSFLRFSESERSKSKLLNDVISDSEHDLFFHRDREEGSAKRMLVDGLVELCWYLPAGKESDRFSNIVAFTNLHGDARDYYEQVAFLSQVSFMNFVLLSRKDVNDHNGITVLQNLAKAPGGLVLMFSDASHYDEVIVPNETLPRKVYGKIRLKAKSAATIKKEICHRITKKLDECGKQSTEQLKLTDCAEIARMIGIHVDEDIQGCKEGKRIATTLVAEIISLDTDPDSTASVKLKLLPLQGSELWHAWAKHDKEQHRHLNRGARGIEQYKSQKEIEKINVRRKQLQLADPPTTSMKLFMSILLQHEGSIRKYFLHWLKILLDDRSRAKLPGLQRQYKAKRKEMNKFKSHQNVDSPTLIALKNDLHRFNEQLLHTSFGLEHLLRELGQIYESVLDVSKHKSLKHRRWQSKQPMITASRQLQAQVSHLPQIAAELLVTGYPLELMDGDASHMPLTWVIAVLDKVKEILGDKRLYVLSVLGIQSTGKSTLLNTMFGVQFAVSAGRCTRGAFIQLLPLNEQLKEDIKCDYFLIVDTEGLRAPELDSAGTQKHDNEMATFVIGLADVTVINIFGEAPGDMDDILQTAVHAFLRMKNVELNSSCQFVHQNVAAISADTKGKIGRDKFHEKLDEMTRNAAKEEQCEGRYQSFNDVISFDDEKDIWYFPTLWKGDPPMAPVNPGYSDMAQALKCGLIDLARKRRSHCTISRFQSRIQQLWGAVLDENFIFSFKNTLEVTVYTELDAKYTQWSWKLQRTMLDWEQENETVIKNTAFEKLHDLENQRIANAKSLLAKVHQSLKGDMEKFFQESIHSEILAQWQGRTERRLDDLHAELEKQAEDHCRTVIRSREGHISVDRMRNSHREKLLKHVKELVSKLEGKQLSEAELKNKFEKKWTEWMQEFAARLPIVHQQDIDIHTAVERNLRSLLQRDDKRIIAKLTKRPLQEWGNPLQLSIKADRHLQSQKWFGFRSVTEEETKCAQRMTNRFLQGAHQYLQDLNKRQIQNFNEKFVCDLFVQFFDNVNQFNTGKEFKFTQEYKTDIALTVGGYALRHFEEMMKVIRKKNDPIEYLKTLKVPFYMTFTSQYSQIAKEKTAADNLCYLLKEPIVTAVTGSLGCMIADDMLSKPTFHTKRALKGQVLLDLGELNSFECFAHYLTDVKASLQSWVKFYTKQHCSRVVGRKSRLEELSEAKLQGVIMAITDAAKHATDSWNTSISDWLSKLHRQLNSVLTINEREVKEVVGAENLKDFKFFTDEIIKGLRKIQESLLQNFQSSLLSQMDSWMKRPYDILCDKLLGCCEQCPFCGEQCELTTPNHDCSHSVELHRPECLGGFQWESTEEMVLDVCSSSVQSDLLFKNVDTNHEWHPYKEYQKYYPNWVITPDSSRQVLSYWKWFVAEYSEQIAKYFNTKETELPDTWISSTWEDAKEDLRTSYNLKLQ